MCLSCGYAGATLQGDPGDTALVCPSCAEDLYARPPRSYAEMEGLLDDVPSMDPGDLIGGRAPLILQRLDVAPLRQRHGLGLAVLGAMVACLCMGALVAWGAVASGLL